MSDTRILKVDVFSPGDVGRERDLVLVAIDDANRHLSAESVNVTLRIADDQPGTADADIVIAIFWTTFDTLTEQEIRRNLENWTIRGRPHIRFFFSQQPYTPTSVSELEQWSQVLKLRDELSRLRIAGVKYQGDEDFERKVREHLRKYSLDIAVKEGLLTTNLPPAVETPQVTPDAFTCLAVSTLTELRAEGLTEPVAEIGLIFSGGNPFSTGGEIQRLRLDLYMNTQITNRIDDAGLSDILLVSEELSGSPPLQGRVSVNSVVFDDVLVDPPGKGSTTIFSIKNIRVNATIPAPGGSGTPGQIIALLKVSPESAIAVNDSVQLLAFVRPSLRFELIVPDKSASGEGGTNAFLQTTPHHGESLGFLRFSGLFSSVFKSKMAGCGGNTEELCTGTRLKAVFHNIPNGVRVFVATGDHPRASKARLIASELGPYQEALATATFNGISVAELTFVSGSATAVWEVISSDPGLIEPLDFAAFIEYESHADMNIPAIGTGTVNGSFAPTPPAAFTASAGAVANATLPIPRFVDTSSAINIVSILLRRTRLLFPFVTNQSGFDTGITISNVSADPVGTIHRAGPVTLIFYGPNAPAPVTTRAVPAGEVYVSLASAMCPNFQGYVVAVCNFYPARGYAIITDIGARNLATGYLAEVMNIEETDVYAAARRKSQEYTLW